MKCKKLIIAAILPLLFYCGKKDVEQKPAKGEIETLRDKYNFKVSEAKEKFDKESGWPDAWSCDGTLWAGLARGVGIDIVKIGLAEYQPGQIHRRPTPDCWTNGIDLGSKSTISRDMLLGYIFGSWKSGDWPRLQRLASYGGSHDWIMGEPWPAAAGEVLMTGNLIGLLGRILCGETDYCPDYAKIPAIHSKSDKDYVQHLTVLYILLDGDVDSRARDQHISRGTQLTNITQGAKDLLEWHKNQKPDDVLFNGAWHLYEDGDFSETVSMLLDPEMKYPEWTENKENFNITYWLLSTKLVLDEFPSDN